MGGMDEVGDLDGLGCHDEIRFLLWDVLLDSHALCLIGLLDLQPLLLLGCSGCISQGRQFPFPLCRREQLPFEGRWGRRLSRLLRQHFRYLNSPQVQARHLGEGSKSASPDLAASATKEPALTTKSVPSISHCGS